VIVINGKQVVNPLNQEVLTIRGIEPGEFTINAHYYESKNGRPVTVTVSIIKVNPRAEVVFYGQTTLARKGDEATLARFTVLPDGGVANVNTLPKKLVQRL
jgi:allantoicase